MTRPPSLSSVPNPPQPRAATSRTRRQVAFWTCAILAIASTSCVGPAVSDADKKAESREKVAAKAEAKAPAEPPKPAPPAPPPAPPKPAFSKDRPPPAGLSPEDLKAYATFMGDPHGGTFTLAEALAGDDKLADAAAGKLYVTIDTDKGKIECELFEKETPLTVANFVGLARGLRSYFDKKKGEWVKGKFFDGLLFHRVIKDFMLQTGDPLGTGTGGPGYLIVDEIDPSLKHVKPGILSMANRGKNTGSSQFFITVAKTPHLDGKHAVFGQCDSPKVAITISEVDVDPRFDHRPIEPVKIKSMTFSRKDGGKK